MFFCSPVRVCWFVRALLPGMFFQSGFHPVSDGLRWRYWQPVIVLSLGSDQLSVTPPSPSCWRPGFSAPSWDRAALP